MVQAFTIVDAIEIIEARLAQLQKLRRETASRSVKRHYNGAIIELDIIVRQLRRMAEHA